MSMFKWDVVDPAPGEAVLPHQRLPWGKTVGLGAQHVVAMFGATFVFPLVMGLDANPRRIWRVVEASATIRGEDAGPPAPLPEQARIGDFWVPQRGIFAMGRVFVGS